MGDRAACRGGARIVPRGDAVGGQLFGPAREYLLPVSAHELCHRDGPEVVAEAVEVDQQQDQARDDGGPDVVTPMSGTKSSPTRRSNENANVNIPANVA